MPNTSRISSAAPFSVSLLLAVLAVLAAMYGGWVIALVPLYAMVLSSFIDRVLGDNTVNPDPETPEEQLFWHKLLTMIWFPLEFVFVFFAIAAVTRFGDFSTLEGVFLMMAIGVASGLVGIVYAHELIHQKSALERGLGDALLAMVMFGHFRTKHILIHHRYVGTPADPVTARYNEGFYYFFPRVLRQGLVWSWRLEASRLAQKGLPVRDRSNPFWRYISWSAAFLAIAGLIGGWPGVGLFLIQAFIAVLFLQLTNYVEHYGLTRKHLGGGKYEHVRPQHSWNSARRFTNYLLINLQRHSDHHYRPDRRFPVLQTYDASEAPQIPFGYPFLAAIALVPPVWLRLMNPRVRKWRAMYYPEIIDWSAYKAGSNPLPESAKGWIQDSRKALAK